MIVMMIVMMMIVMVVIYDDDDEGEWWCLWLVGSGHVHVHAVLGVVDDAAQVPNGLRGVRLDLGPHRGSYRGSQRVI